MKFRPGRFAPHVLLVLLLAAGLALGLATRFPAAEIIARAEAWPVVGAWAGRFRRAYLPPPAAGAAAAEPGDERASVPPVKVEVVQVIDPDLVGIKPKVWARPGTPILAAPDLAARELARVKHLFPLSRLERRGDWFRVRYGTRLSGFHKGWVYLPDYRDPTPEELTAPAPVLPLAPVPIAPEARAAAVRHLAETATEDRCGPFALLTDVRDPEPLAVCRRVGSGVEAAHRRRYGLELVGEAAETILLFAREDSFRGFREEAAEGWPGEAFASAAQGFVAVPVGGRPPAAVESSLIHELTHLLNRRSLGPALPPWLDQGMARDLETVGVGGAARALPVPVGRVESLADLFDLDPEVFQARARRNYRAAGRWIGYLVDGPDPALADGMKAFLGAVAAGEPIRAELLLAHLGRDWSELEAGFRAWEQRGELAAAD